MLLKAERDSTANRLFHQYLNTVQFVGPWGGRFSFQIVMSQNSFCPIISVIMQALQQDVQKNSEHIVIHVWLQCLKFSLTFGALKL